MALRSVYNYWFDPHNKNNIRHWILITNDKAKKQKEIEDRFCHSTPLEYYIIRYHLEKIINLLKTQMETV